MDHSGMSVSNFSAHPYLFVVMWAASSDAFFKKTYSTSVFNLKRRVNFFSIFQSNFKPVSKFQVDLVFCASSGYISYNEFAVSRIWERGQSANWLQSWRQRVEMKLRFRNLNNLIRQKVLSNLNDLLKYVSKTLVLFFLYILLWNTEWTVCSL